MSKNAGDSISKAVNDAVKNVNKQIYSRARRVSNALRNAELEVLSGQRSGRKYRKPNTKRATYTASAPGEPPARRTGALRLHWTQGQERENNDKGIKVKAYIESNTPYAGYLDKGTTKMEARPFVEKIQEKAKPEVIRILSESYD